MMVYILCYKLSLGLERLAQIIFYKYIIIKLTDVDHYFDMIFLTFNFMKFYLIVLCLILLRYV